MTFRIDLGGALLCLSAVLAGCGGVGAEGEELGSIESALCTFRAPLIAEIRAENAGPVAPGGRQIYFVTVRNTNSTDCGPVSVSLQPDQVAGFTIAAQPAPSQGVGSNGTAQFRVEISSNANVAEGVYQLGFSILGAAGAPSTRGVLPFEVDLDNPTGCSRQRPQFSVTPNSPAPVPAGTAQPYQVTVRNIDNPACGADVFNLVPDSFRLFSIASNGPFAIAPQSSAVFNVTARSDASVARGIFDLGFTLVGSHHGALTNRGSVRYTVR